MKIDENILEWAIKFMGWFQKDSYFPLRPDFSEDEFIATHTENNNGVDYGIEVHVWKLPDQKDGGSS